MRRAVPAVLLPRRHPQPRRAGDARARSTRAASSATRWCTPTAPRSTTRTCSSLCVVGDGEAETGPLAAQLALQQVPQPGHRRRGAADPAPQRLQDRQPDRAGPDPRGRARSTCCAGYGYHAARRGRRRARRRCTEQLAATLDAVLDEIAEIQRRRPRPAATPTGPRWPMIVLRTPKGWTGPEDRRRPAGRGHLPGPPGAARRRPRQRRAPARSSRSGCAATGPRSCSTPTGALVAELAALAPRGDRRMSANPHANGGLLLRDLRPARLPRLRRRRSSSPAPADAEATARARRLAARRHRRATRTTFRLFGPGRDRVQPAAGGVRGDRPGLGRPRSSPGDDHLAPRRPGDGGAVRAPVPGLAGGLPAHRPARPVQLLRGVHPHRRLDVQPARQVAEDHAAHPVAARRSPR